MSFKTSNQRPISKFFSVYLFLGCLSAAAFFFDGVAHANDTSFAAIAVESINTNAKVGTEMSFKGAEARNIMDLLPRISSAGGPIYEEHNRTLAIKSPGYMIVLHCSDFNFQSPNGPAKTPECSITFDRRIDESDDMPFTPEKQCR